MMRVQFSTVLLAALLVAARATSASGAMGDLTYSTTLSPEALMSASGDTMASLGGQPMTPLHATPAGVKAHAGMICLMSEPDVVVTETLSGSYAIDLALTDTDSGHSYTFHLVPPGGLTSHISIPLNGPVTSDTNTDLPPTVSQVIGSTLYTVSADAATYFTPPGPPLDKGRPGETGGFILAIAATPAPEPAALGTVALILPLLRRRAR